jgi:hypothetical protein
VPLVGSAELEEHFNKRKLKLGSCGRLTPHPAATNTPHSGSRSLGGTFTPTPCSTPATKSLSHWYTRCGFSGTARPTGTSAARKRLPNVRQLATHPGTPATPRRAYHPSEAPADDVFVPPAADAGTTAESPGQDRPARTPTPQPPKRPRSRAHPSATRPPRACPPPVWPQAPAPMWSRRAAERTDPNARQRSGGRPRQRKSKRSMAIRTARPPQFGR